MSLEHPTILVIDDSAVARQHTRESLENAGFEVFELETPTAITSIARETQPDLIMMDVAMPGINGDTAVEIMREAGLRGRIALYSALPEEDLADLAKDCLADGFIIKTGDKNHLVEQVRQLLKSTA